MTCAVDSTETYFCEEVFVATPGVFVNMAEYLASIFGTEKDK